VRVISRPRHRRVGTAVAVHHGDRAVRRPQLDGVLGLRAHRARSCDDSGPRPTRPARLALRSSYLVHGTATIAFWDFAVFYLLAALVTLRVYLGRPSQKVADEPVLATAGV